MRLQKKGRYTQSDNFSKGADERMEKAFNDENIVRVNNKQIVYRKPEGNAIVMTDGDYWFKPNSSKESPECGNFTGREQIPAVLKTDSKTAARRIAKWCSEYLILDEPVKKADAIRPNYDDWHTWCNL